MAARSNTLTVTITINGTDENPWHRFGLECNPFPEIAEAEFTAGCLQINRLAGGPIRSEQQIRQILAGFKPDFIDLCCQQFQPGKQVTFQVSFPRKRA